MNKYPEFSLLLVDDEESWLRTLSLSLLSAAGIDNVTTCRDGRKVMGILEKEDVGLVLLDLTMPNLQGEEILQDIRAHHPDVKVIIITGRNDVDAVVQCMKNGAFDYFIKIWGEDRLITGIRHAVQIVELERQNRRAGERFLERDLDHPEAFASIVTASDAMNRIFRYVEAISVSREPVIVTGESGVGKEEIARAVHAVSGRGELVGVNMAGLNDSMLEDTLFGHKRGAFTNAQDERGGLVVRARDGTLFLDEIGEMSNAAQAKLLRFIQEGEYYPIGSDVPKKLSCRVVVATNRDLDKGLKDGSFRRDLFYRFAHRIHIPPLRERREDIPLLIAHFLRRSAEAFRRRPQTVSPAAMLMLSRYDWPGNVRELQKTMLHTASLPAEVLDIDDFVPMLDAEAIPDGNAPGAEDLLDLLLRLDEMPSFAEMKQIMTNAALIRGGGRQTAAAKILGISQPALSKRLKAERGED